MVEPPAFSFETAQIVYEQSALGKWSKPKNPAPNIAVKDVSKIIIKIILTYVFLFNSFYDLNVFVDKHYFMMGKNKFG